MMYGSFCFADFFSKVKLNFRFLRWMNDVLKLKRLESRGYVLVIYRDLCIALQMLNFEISFGHKTFMIYLIKYIIIHKYI